MSGQRAKRESGLKPILSGDYRLLTPRQLTNNYMSHSFNQIFFEYIEEMAEEGRRVPMSEFGLEEAEAEYNKSQEGFSKCCGAVIKEKQVVGEIIGSEWFNVCSACGRDAV